MKKYNTSRKDPERIEEIKQRFLGISSAMTHQLHTDSVNEYPRYGKLKDNTIVKIWLWSTTEPQEIYFKYRLLTRIKLKRKTAWAYREDFIGFADKIKDLRRNK